MALSPLQKKKLTQVEVTDTGTPIRYLPLDHVYSASAQCYTASGSSNVMSKKVKARKLTDSYVDLRDEDSSRKKQSSFFGRFYTRRPKKPRLPVEKSSISESESKAEINLSGLEDGERSRGEEFENGAELGEIGGISRKRKRNRGIGNFELASLRIDSSFSNGIDCRGTRERRVRSTNTRKQKFSNDCRDLVLFNDSSYFLDQIKKGGTDETENGVEISGSSKNKKKKGGIGRAEVASLGIDLSFSSDTDCSEMKERRLRSTTNARKQSSLNDCRELVLFNCSSDQTKKWVDLSYENVDQSIFIGFQCKVYWPLDDEWYSGRVASYNSETGKHHVKYDDGEEESLLFSKEKIKFYISRQEMLLLNLKINVANKDNIGLSNDELLVLAAIFDDCGDIEPGDIIWAKVSGHAIWPAVVMNELDVGARKGLKANNGERSIPVQFFGTHDFARITMKQVISFLRGLHLSYHMKCKQSSFRRSLEEAKVYLTEQMLPSKMLRNQNGIEVDDCESASGEDDESNSSDDDKRMKRTSDCIKTCPFEIDDLLVISLGKIVTDSEHFHDERYIWPEGYTAERKFISATDPSLKSLYKMEVLRDPELKFRPLFRITMDGREEFKGSNPTACWNKIYRRIRKNGNITSNGFSAEDGLERIPKSGSHMFGFSNPKVSKIIKELSNSRKSSIYSGSKLAPKRYQDLPVGYRPVRVEWKDLDKCNVCHMDEEYANNVFLQCDRCRMMVHARCYGELQPDDGVLWLCKLCGPEAPKIPPPCCLCPIIGGAMKPTTDGRWAHLACAIWIPETCLSDIKRMEPIDGLGRINKDRWKLLCSICGVTYGACIQCSNSTCRVAYHPLCARAAGLCVELEDEDKLHLMSFDEDEDDQCIRLFSFCKKHRQPSNERSPSDEQMQPVVRHCSKYIPPSNPSGCARTEPYDFVGRRGRKEPEAVAAASLKRLYVENKPYLVTGYCQNGKNSASSNEVILSRFSSSFQKSKLSEHDTTKSVLSMAEKYNYMRETVRLRLAFGKSGIHRFGVFAKHPHKAGDMVIEYIGELVRPSIADRREHFIYNSLVGAGTYMFRIDDERVIDATRAGSIAHLINHSCEPNCYSRVVSIHGEEHIIIFAKRDISIWEEITYDYRFFSIGEQLACYCGFPRCRGVVNDIEAEEQVGKLWVPRSELIDWKEDKV